MNNFRNLKESLIKDLKIKEFSTIRKASKRNKLYKICDGLSYIVIGSSLLPVFSNEQFIIAVAGIVGVLFFDSKIIKTKELIKDEFNKFNEYYRIHLNSMELTEFRINKINSLKSDDITKRDYIILLEEELQLLYTLIKQECEYNSNLDVAGYKRNIEHIFGMINIAVESKLLTKEDGRGIKRKWSYNMQSLLNQYSKTGIEVDLKCLQID